ncbi:hypothetical protein WJX74_004591 [Apatococcus lobatus]|uniref:Uncharacterized protein n=1 Tax=Apatococcus lobatus TaxID=904363 RepID=A0AAW1S9J5_9CHLO
MSYQPCILSKVHGGANSPTAQHSIADHTTDNHWIKASETPKHTEGYRGQHVLQPCAIKLSLGPHWIPRLVRETSCSFIGADRQIGSIGHGNHISNTNKTTGFTA